MTQTNAEEAKDYAAMAWNNTNSSPEVAQVYLNLAQVHATLAVADAIQELVWQGRQL
jgi:hypothetical protein